jgi:hypothetical protein
MEVAGCLSLDLNSPNQNIRLHLQLIWLIRYGAGRRNAVQFLLNNQYFVPVYVNVVSLQVFLLARTQIRDLSCLIFRFVGMRLSLWRKFSCSVKMSHSKYEYVRRYEADDKLLPNTWIVVRIDGKAFHK